MKNTSILDTPIDFDSGDFFSLVSLAAGAAIAQQDAMGEQVIGDGGWRLDIVGRSISLGGRDFPCGLIGSEDTAQGTWLWGWAATQSNLPESFSAPSRRAKRALSGTAEFSQGKFMLDELHTGHNLSMVCTGVSGESVCYYRCPYDGGAFFVQVEGLPDEVFAPLEPQCLMRRYLEIVRSFYCDHRLLAAGFLYRNGTDFTLDNDGAVTADFGRTLLRFDFENAGGLYRVTNISFH